MSNKKRVDISVDGYVMNDWLDEMLEDEGVDKDLWGLIADEVLGTMDEGGYRDMADFDEHLYLIGKIDDIYDMLRVEAKDYMHGRLNRALEKDYPKVFEYMGHEFVPVRHLDSSESKNVVRHISTEGVVLSKENGNWDYGEFIAAAGDGSEDLFRMVGHDELWIPGNSMMFRYEG